MTPPAPFTVLKYRDKRIGIIGLTLSHLDGKAPLDKLQGVKVEDEEIVLEKYLKEVRGKVDVLILLAHTDLSKLKEIARRHQEIDLIIAGHSHDLLKKPLKIGRTYIVEAGKDAKYLMKIILSTRDGEVKLKSYSLIDASSLKPDEEMLRVLGLSKSPRDPELKKIISELKSL